MRYAEDGWWSCEQSRPLERDWVQIERDAKVCQEAGYPREWWELGVCLKQKETGGGEDE